MENVTSTPKKMMKISELLSLSFKIYDNKFWSLIGLVLLPALMMVAFILIFGLYFLLTTILAKGAILSALILVLVLLSLVAIAFLVIFSVLTKVALALVVRENPSNFSIMDMVKKAKQYWKGYFWIAFLGGLLTVLGFMVVIIPGIILAVYFSMATWIFFDHGTRGWAALKQSQAMVSGYWWAVFWRFALPMLILMFVLGLPSSFMEEKSATYNAYSGFTQIISMLLVPFFSAYAFNIYKNLKEIKA